MPTKKLGRINDNINNVINFLRRNKSYKFVFKSSLTGDLIPLSDEELKLMELSSIDELKKIHGLCDRENKIIYINFTKGEYVDTIIHEVLHVIYPTLSETKITKCAVEITANMNIRQLKSLNYFINKRIQEAKE